MITQIHRNVSSNNITSLKEREVFVFGSNKRGIHGKGAALTAYKDFGAAWNVGVGPTGNCYAIPTKDEYLQTLPLDEIKIHIEEFLQYAESHLLLKFLVTEVGCGLAGYKPLDIASIFFTYDIPPNVYLPESFWQIYDAIIDKDEKSLDILPTLE